MKQYILFLSILFVFGCSSDSEDDIIPIGANMGKVEPEINEVIEELKGEFVNGAHPTMGTAAISIDRKKLNLTAFKSDAGPLLEFYLATALDGVTYVSLGELQGLDGDYTYDIPGGVNFDTHKYLLVWCVDFKVSFGHAILE